MNGPAADETGSVTVLGIGLVAVCLLAMVVLVDGSAAFLQRCHLLALADAAALSGAQGIDLGVYYAEGASDRTRLDPGAVVSRVRGHLARADAGATPGLVVERVSSDGREVLVELSAPLRLPFLSDAFDTRVAVAAAASLSFRGSDDAGAAAGSRG